MPANDRRRRDPLAPERYPSELYDQKQDNLYRHIYERYADTEHSIYAAGLRSRM